MIERRALEAHAIVGERLQKLHDLRALLLVQTDVAHARPEVAAGGHVAIPRVELHDLFERRGAAGVEVRARELDVAKARRLESAIGAAARCRREQRRAERVQSGGAGVVLDRADARAEEPERARVQRDCRVTRW